MEDKRIRIINIVFLILTIIYTVVTLCGIIVENDGIIVELGKTLYLVGFIILVINKLLNKELNKALKVLFILLIITIIMNIYYIIMPRGLITFSFSTVGILLLVAIIVHKIVLAINVICTLKGKNNFIVRYLLILITILSISLIIGCYNTEVKYWILGIIYIYIAVYMFYLEKEVSLKEILKSVIIMAIVAVLVLLILLGIFNVLPNSKSNNLIEQVKNLSNIESHTAVKMETLQKGQQWKIQYNASKNANKISEANNTVPYEYKNLLIYIQCQNVGQDMVQNVKKSKSIIVDNREFYICKFTERKIDLFTEIKGDLYYIVSIMLDKDLKKITEDDLQNIRPFLDIKVLYCKN